MLVLEIPGRYSHEFPIGSHVSAWLILQCYAPEEGHSLQDIKSTTTAHHNLNLDILLFIWSVVSTFASGCLTVVYRKYIIALFLITIIDNGGGDFLCGIPTLLQI